MAADGTIVVADGAAAIHVVTVLVAARSLAVQVTGRTLGAFTHLPVTAAVVIATVQGCGDEEQEKRQEPGQGAGIYDHSQGVLSSSFGGRAGARPPLQRVTTRVMSQEASVIPVV